MTRSNLPLPSSRSASAIAASGPGAAAAAAAGAASGLAGALVTALSPGLASAGLVSAGFTSTALLSAGFASVAALAGSLAGAVVEVAGLASSPDCAAWSLAAGVLSAAAAGLVSPAGFSAELLAGPMVCADLAAPSAAGASFDAFAAGSDAGWLPGCGAAPASVVGLLSEPAKVAAAGRASRRAMAVEASKRSTRNPGIANSPSQPARSEALLLDDNWPQFMADAAAGSP